MHFLLKELKIDITARNDLLNKIYVLCAKYLLLIFKLKEIRNK